MGLENIRLEFILGLSHPRLHKAVIQKEVLHSLLSLIHQIWLHAETGYFGSYSGY